MILKRKLFTLIFSCLTFCTLNNCMEVNNAAGASEMLEIETSDGCRRHVAKELCLHSKVIRDMLEDLKDGDSQISLPEVSSQRLELLLPILQLIQEERKELSEQLNSKSLQELAELLKASNYLDIEQLLNAVLSSISAQLCTSDARHEFCTNEDFLHGIGLAELPRELSVLLGSKIAKHHSGLRAYLLNNCTISNKILKGNTNYVKSAKFNNTGDKVVSASDDRTVR
ncbi:hypothetical protein E3J79_01280, partial [Candidatus Dependentiae bacterium]